MYEYYDINIDIRWTGYSMNIYNHKSSDRTTVQRLVETQITCKLIHLI